MFLTGITKGPLSQVDTTQQYPVGERYWRPDAAITTAGHRGFGGQTWRYIKNGGAGTISAGHIVQRKTGATDWTGQRATNQSVGAVSGKYMMGVAQHDIAAASYGWILTKGAGNYLADTGGTTIDHFLILGNAVDGCFDSQANTVAEITAATTPFGIIVTAALATALGIAYFNGFAD